MYRSDTQLRAASNRPDLAANVGLERLEDRRLLSASPNAPCGPRGGFPGGRTLDAIEFGLAPAAVQTGLNTLATTDGLSDPTATTEVALGNRGGVETYTVTIGSTGTVSKLTVDSAGNPVTTPTLSTTTFGTLASAPAAEITAIAAATSLAAPTSDTVVNVSTTAAGVATYSVALSRTGQATPASTWAVAPSATVRVDASGNPIGNQQLPFSVFSTTIQNGLNAGAPTGATALAATSTQGVDVRASDGITTYSTRFTVSGNDTTVTVNAAGTAVTAASQTTADFSAIPAVAQTELQTLAAAEGYSGTIATAQSVTVRTETGGSTTLYAVTLSVPNTTADGTTTTGTHDETLVVDGSGNPTTLSADLPIAVGLPGRFGGGWAHVGVGGGEPGGFPSGGWSGGTTTGATATSATVTSSKATATAVVATVSASTLTTITAADTPATPTLGTAFALFASAMTSAPVPTDLAALHTATATFKADVKGLSKTDAATFRADEKGIAKAIKAIGSELTADQKALRSDSAKDGAALRADQTAIRKDRKNAAALANDEANLASGKSAAYAALSAELDALKALIDANAGVTAARAKLATDLPAVATAQGAVVSAYATLQTDVGTALSNGATSA